MSSIQNTSGFYATEKIYIKQVIEGTLKLSAVLLLISALLISGI